MSSHGKVRANAETPSLRNPWLDIPLADYEAHMALPTVGQSQLIAAELSVRVQTHWPNSIAIIGYVSRRQAFLHR